MKRFAILVTGVLISGCLDADLRGTKCQLDAGEDLCRRASLECRPSDTFGGTPVCDKPRDGGGGVGGGGGGGGGGGTGGGTGGGAAGGSGGGSGGSGGGGGASGDGGFAGYNVMFVTSTGFAGNLEGLAGADRRCMDHARDAGLPGSFRAFLSTADGGASARLGSARGWVRPDGRVVADAIADLFPQSGAQRFVYGAHLDELGRRVNARVWTGTTKDGNVSSNDCDGWTSDSGSTVGRAGATSRVNDDWISESGRTCDQALRLYCFGIDFQRATSPYPRTGRVAFLSSQAVPLDGGISAFDAQCQTEATAALLPGVFRAFVAAGGLAAGERFDAGGPAWQRLDGAGLTLTPAELVSSATPQLMAGLNLTASGTFADRTVWTGSPNPSVVGTQTCAEWSSGDAGATWVGLNGAVTPEFFGFSNSSDSGACSSSRHLYCLEL